MQQSRLRMVLRRLVTASPAVAALTFAGGVLAPTSTQTAIANGDTRTINLFHAHRKDSISVTFRRNGSYDSAGLAQLNHFLRDWRNDQQTRMDPRLFDVIWESQRGASSSAPIIVLSAYRSPTTNAMLRSRSRAVAKESQHMYGKAMDMRMPDANMARVRETALRLQRGGVGWYGSSNFVHLDVGSVRAWPRLSYDHLARLFPDGKSVHISADGRVLPGYEEARAMVASRGGDYVPTLAQVKEKSFLARLFGFDDDDEADARPAAVASRGGARGRAVASARAPARSQVAAYAPAASTDDNSAAAFFRADAARRSGNEPVMSAPAAAPAPVRVAARAEPVRPEPVRAEPARPEPAKIEPAKPAPAAEAPEARPSRRQIEEQVANAPVPPRRPSPAQIAALIQKSQPEAGVPMPPQRPEALAVVADATLSRPLTEQQTTVASVETPVPPVRTAAVMRAPNMPAGNLPAVITRGANAPVNQAAISAPGLLAYAPTIQPSGEENIRKATPRKPGAAKAAPVVARTVGVRSARVQENVPLVAARLDRSNFTGLTSSRSFSEQTVSSSVGSSVAPLRAAAKHDPSRLLFAPPRRALAGLYDEFKPDTG